MRTLLLVLAISCFGYAFTTIVVQCYAFVKDIDLSDKDLGYRYLECFFMGAVALWMRDDYSPNDESNDN